MRKKAKNNKNLYRSGNPVKLTERIELNCRLSREEFIQINRQLIQKIMRPNYITYIFGFIMAALAISLFTRPYLTKPGIEINYIQLITEFSLIAIFIGIGYYYLRSNVGKAYDNTEFIKGDVTYIFDSDNYEIVSSVSNIKSS